MRACPRRGQAVDSGWPPAGDVFCSHKDLARPGRLCWSSGHRVVSGCSRRRPAGARPCAEVSRGVPCSWTLTPCCGTPSPSPGPDSFLFLSLPPTPGHLPCVVPSNSPFGKGVGHPACWALRGFSIRPGARVCRSDRCVQPPPCRGWRGGRRGCEARVPCVAHVGEASCAVLSQEAAGERARGARGPPRAERHLPGPRSRDSVLIKERRG